tara:strand:+ start:4068 stop:4634 length:567 start_codon:yes stop_codon:yes gene_type:complete
MKSSYKSRVDFGDIIDVVCKSIKNKKLIVEFGILDGFSLSHLLDSSASDTSCQVKAFDIFEDFVGNGANYDSVVERFRGEGSRCEVAKADFYKSVDLFENGSIDILHIDIANDGDVYDFAFKEYARKVKSGGVMMLEGGGSERDEVEWMNKYNKRKIGTVLRDWVTKGSPGLIHVVEKFPSMTIVYFP